MYIIKITTWGGYDTIMFECRHHQNCNLRWIWHYTWPGYHSPNLWHEVDLALYQTRIYFMKIQHEVDLALYQTRIYFMKIQHEVDLALYQIRIYFMKIQHEVDLALYRTRIYFIKIVRWTWSGFMPDQGIPHKNLNMKWIWYYTGPGYSSSKSPDDVDLVLSWTRVYLTNFASWSGSGTIPVNGLLHQNRKFVVDLLV